MVLFIFSCSQVDALFALFAIEFSYNYLGKRMYTQERCIRIGAIALKRALACMKYRQRTYGMYYV